MSPHSNTLFHQSIQSSGSLYSPWGKTTKTFDLSRAVAKAVGCKSKKSKAVKQCMKKVSVQEIWDAVAPYGLMRNSMDFLNWTPVLDKDFFDGKTIEELTKIAPKKPTIYGMTKGEGIICTVKTANIIASVFAYRLGIDVSEEAAFSKANFSSFVDNYALEPSFAGNNVKQMKKLLEKYYERNENQATPNNKFWFKRYTDVVTESNIFGPVTREIREKKKNGWEQQYIYLPAYINKADRPKFGVEDLTPHAYEYQYLTDAEPYFPVNKSSFDAAELALTERLVSGFAQFVKTGKPGTSENPWPKVDDVYKPKYLDLGATISIKDTIFTKPGILWEKIHKLGYGESTQHFD